MSDRKLEKKRKRWRLQRLEQHRRQNPSAKRPGQVKANMKYLSGYGDWRCLNLRRRRPRLSFSISEMAQILNMWRERLSTAIKAGKFPAPTHKAIGCGGNHLYYTDREARYLLEAVIRFEARTKKVSIGKPDALLTKDFSNLVTEE